MPGPRPGAQGALNSDLTSLRVKQLLLVMALGESKSVRKAAETLHVSQPAASKALMELEATLGVRLFLRERTGLSPTDAGRCVMSYARDMVQQLRRMRFDLDRIQHRDQAILRIGSIMGAVPENLSTCLRRLIEERPNILIEAEENTSLKLMLQLRSGEVDLVIARSAHLDTHSDIDCVPLDEEAVYVVAGRTHPLAGQDVYSCAQLSQFSWVAYENSSPLSQVLTDWFEQETDTHPTIMLRTASALITVAALNASHMLALLPASVFGLVGANNQISRIHTSAPLTAGGYFAYWNRQSLRLDLVNLALAELKPAAPPPP
ncbi:LysR family transcriptional regulator [Rhizobacter sp. Root1221]|uniref:LysR family transcriptional regulator n=1 Tax=Rhizobacter sp. Root1221 TaxID=1736433 RepID=UPI00138F2FB5|nr:LysR family transcriptional regulator [Rhizobacter sp. Root1221]